MLTPERHQRIVAFLKEHGVATVQELVQATDSSESTIRRDLILLEEAHRLIRFHGGAQLPHNKSDEPTMVEKQNRYQKEKKAIAKQAASHVESGDCIYVDAGTTTAFLVDYISHDDVVVVTNGLSIIQKCLEKGLKTFILGGEIKGRTNALIGRGAIESLKLYRFDACFLGMNGVDIKSGFTTPDPDEAYVKETAMGLANKNYVLADQSKFGEVSFAFVNPISRATVITNDVDTELIQDIKTKTEVEVVTI